MDPLEKRGFGTEVLQDAGRHHTTTQIHEILGFKPFVSGPQALGNDTWPLGDDLE